MTTVVIAMLVCVAAGALVLALVAVPRLRDGDRVLTRDGRDAVDDATRRARAMAARAQRPGEPVRPAAAAPADDEIDLRDEAPAHRPR